jgi:hypothetical protein
MKNYLFLFLSFSVFCHSASAEKQLIERTVEVQSADKNPLTARAEMTTEATEKVSTDLIKEIIGEAKFNRNRAIVMAKIVKNSARYIPFSKPGELVPLPEGGFKMTSLLKLSVDDLQALLLENGLFYESDGTPMVIPAIRWIDRVNGQGWAWWAEKSADNKAFLKKQGKALENALKTAFSKQHFYLLRPQEFKLHEALPMAFQNENLGKDDWQSIAQKFSSQIIIDGEVVLSKSAERSEAFNIELKMTAIQSVNGRVIAEVARQFETDAGGFEFVTDKKLREALEATSQDLAAQVLDAWQKGAIGSNLYKLTLRGRLPLIQQEAFKEILKSKVREVKNIRERLISSDQIVFEVDSALGPKELGQKAPKIQVSGLELVLESSSETEVTYRVSR